MSQPIVNQLSTTQPQAPKNLTTNNGQNFRSLEILFSVKSMEGDLDVDIYSGASYGL